MIGKLVRHRHPDAPRPGLAVDDIEASDLRLLAAIARERRRDQRLAVRAQNRAAALVEPLRRYANLSRRGSPTLQAGEVHLHAVREFLGISMHCLTIVRA